MWRVLIPAALMVLAACEKSSDEAPQALGAAGESCTKRSDCMAGLKCVDNKCIDGLKDAKPAEPPAQTGGAPAPEPPPPAETGGGAAPTPPPAVDAETAGQPALDGPGGEEPANKEASLRAAAEEVRAWVRKNRDGLPLPASLFDKATKLSIALKIDACDGDPKKCVSRVNLKSKADLEKWLEENVKDPPGMGTGTLSKCNDSDCCTFTNLAKEAAKDEMSIQTDFHELRAACFTVEADQVTAVKRIKLIKY